MALILKDNTYLKLNLDGNYVIYKDKTSRNKFKKAPSYEIIKAKYEELIYEVHPSNNVEEYYYNPTEIMTKFNALLKEYERYKACYSSCNNTGEFPIMEQYFKNIKNSIPLIVSSGKLGISADSLEELYSKVKEYEIFGKVTEVQDA